MKTKFIAKLSSFIFLFVLCALTLAGCATPWTGPKTEADVTGNGGLAVQKGEYLYFVNGYVEKSTLTAGDNKGNFDYTAIYGAKLNENNELEYNEDGTIKNCKKIVSKVGGYDNTALYVFGDYLYFSTPYSDTVVNPDNRQQEHNFNLTEFYSVKLDGSGLKKIYTTQNDSADLQFTFVKTKNANDVNLAVYDGSKLVVINCSTTRQSLVSEDVTDVAFPSVDEFKYSNNQITNQESAVYYTRSASEDENIDGNVLAYAVLGENVENIILKDDNTYTLKSASKDALVISYKSSNDINECNYFITFDQDGVPQKDINEIKNQQLDDSGLTDVLLCGFEEGNPVGIITKNAKNKLAIKQFNGGQPVVLNDTLSLTPLKISGNYVYAYDDNKSLYRINYKQALVAQDKSSCTELIYDSTKLVDEEAEGEETVADIYFDAKTNFAIFGNYVYFYIPVEGDSETGYYLNRINLIDAEKTAELVGVIDENHIKTETENQ